MRVGSRDTFTHPESFTTARPARPHRSSARNPAAAGPARGSGRPQWSISTRTPERSSRGDSSTQLVVDDLHVSEHVQRREIAEGGRPASA